jgi:cytoskeletal protein RodZ
VFEIGSTLLEARQRKRLSLFDAAESTRIRVKYLSALEEERFDALPAEVYARGFLRTYAEYLGLNGDLFVSELNERIEASKPPPPPPPPESRFRMPALDGRVWALLGACAVVGLALVAGWHRGGSSARSTLPASGTSSAAFVEAAPDRPKATTTTTSKQSTSPVGHLTLIAARGDCWLSVHAWSRDGRVLYEGLLRTGESVPVAGKRIWIRIGAPWNLDARLNGRLLKNLPRDTANVLVAPSGLTSG